MRTIGREFADPRRNVIQVLVHDFRGRLAHKGSPARQHFKNDAAERVEVGLGRDRRPAADLFRRHVGKRSHRLAGGGDLGRRFDRGQSEIAQFEFAGRRQQKIARLHVTMNDPAFVGIGQARGHLQGKLDRRFPGEFPTFLEQMVESSAFDQLHGVKVLVSFADAAETADNVGVPQRIEDFQFTLEA